MIYFCALSHLDIKMKFVITSHYNRKERSDIIIVSAINHIKKKELMRMIVNNFLSTEQRR